MWTCGQYPFPGITKEVVDNKILNYEPAMGELDVLPQCSDDAKEFIRKCLRKEKDQRPSAQDLLGGNGGAVDPWIATVNVDLDEETKQAIGQTFTSVAPKSDVKIFFNSLIANLLVDSERLAHLGKLFQMIDINKSGSVNKEEFRQFMENHIEE